MRGYRVAKGSVKFDSRCRSTENFISHSKAGFSDVTAIELQAYGRVLDAGVVGWFNWANFKSVTDVELEHSVSRAKRASRNLATQK